MVMQETLPESRACTEVVTTSALKGDGPGTSRQEVVVMPVPMVALGGSLCALGGSAGSSKPSSPAETRQEVVVMPVPMLALGGSLYAPGGSAGSSKPSSPAASTTTSPHTSHGGACSPVASQNRSPQGT